MNDYVIGIDLGTGNSCVGVMKDNKIEIITNSDGERTTPSFVAFTENEKLVGLAAKNQYAMNPKNTVYEVKRLMGRRFDDPEVQEDIKRFTYKVVNKNGYPVIEVEYKHNIQQFTPEQISAMILTKMKETAEEFLGCPVKRAVITVPAYFNDAQRQATKDAGTIAGLKVERLIAEPTSSVLAYGLNNSMKGEKNVIVIDPGSGTYDVSIINCDFDAQGGVFEVKATSGNSHLGGSDFDAYLVEYFIKDFSRKYHVDPDELKKNSRACGRLKSACERCKKTLSTATSSTLEIDQFYNGIDYYTSLTRAKFENICGELFKKHMVNIEKCLQDSKLSKADIDEVIMTGGTSRIPKLCEMIQEYFNGKNLNKSINPDECVAYGAAVQGDILSGHAGNATKDILLLDVTPLSLGIETQGEIMTVLIPRNTTIPAKKTMDSFSTAVDNQPGASIVIYQGESELIVHNTKLGEFNITGLPPAKRGQLKISVTFDIDANGILKVSAEELTSHKGGNIKIKSMNSKMSQADIDAAIKKAEEFKEEDRKRKEVVDAKNKLESGFYQIKDSLGEMVKGKEDEFGVNELMKIGDWIDEHPNESKEVYEQKYDEMMKKAQEITKKVQAQQGSQQGSQAQSGSTNGGPSVEEVD